MGQGPDDDLHHRPHEEIAHDVEELREDLGFEREVLGESIKHDYSTSDTGIVPLNRRRPLWHFASLWMTFAAGFSFLFVGFEMYQNGRTLGGTAGIAALALAMYLAYVMPAAYLGSRTGQTHALLTRSVFGVAGSVLVSAFVFIAPLGWVGFQAGLLAQIWDGLYGWGHVELITIVLAAVMIANNLLGFTGISVFARYIVTPLIFLWVLYMVIKAGVSDASQLHGIGKGITGGVSFWALTGLVIGFAMWGNEPDVWRYGKPKFWWPLPAYSFALGLGFMLFTVGGWMMAKLAATADFGPVIRYTTEYSLFGAFWLAWILATISQFAINDGNYYESVNALQNLFGGWKPWRRWYSCAICAAGGAFAAWYVNYHVLNGFFKVAGFLAVTVPCATVIMCVDHFLLPRLFRISRPLTKVPAWKDTSFINWPAFVALCISVSYGAWASGLWPGEDPSRYWGPAALTAWVMGGALYIVGVAITRSVVPNVRAALGFSRHVLNAEIPPTAIIDIASVAEGTAPSIGVPVPARAK